MNRADTFPKLVARNAAAAPHAVALREKALGIWQTYSWSDYHAKVKQRALGLRALGVATGDVVALLGDNRPDWVWGEVAAHACGALTLGIYRDALEEEVAYLITYADASVVFVEDEEQVDKLLSLGEKIGSVRWIIYSDPRGMRKYEDPRLLSMTQLEERAAQRDAAHQGEYDALVAATSGEAPAILCTTSGTSAQPKLAVLSAARLLRHCESYLAVDPKRAGDEYVSVLPLPWIMEQIYALGQALLVRSCVNFVEKADTTMADLREIGPSFLLLAPRVWEQIAADVRARMMDAARLKQLIYEAALRLGTRTFDKGRRRSWLAEILLFRPLRDRLGFARLRSAATGGAALGPDTFRFFQVLGVPLRQLYGQTELMGAYTIHRAGDVDFDTVGLPFDGVAVRIDGADAGGVGEIATRHPNGFLGYYKNPQATRADLGADGWMKTGDAGFSDAKGHLVVIDRVRDLATTTRGERFSPQFIENKLKFCPYIAEAVIVGERRPWLAALVCIRFSIVAKWAEKRRIAFTTYSDLAARAEVRALLRHEVERVNQALPAAQRIRKFVLLYKELDADDGELTRTRKVRRGVIAQKYADIIDALYAGRREIDVDSVVTFQDGTRQRLRTRLVPVDLAHELRPVAPRLAHAIA